MMKKVVVIGTGNLSTRFLPVLRQSRSFDIIQAIGRSTLAKDFLVELDLPYNCDLQKIQLQVDIVLLMVNDDAIKSISEELTNLISQDTLLIHFSGALGIEAIDPYFSNRAVAWPIMSISQDDDDALENIPIACLGSNASSLEQTENLVKNISSNTFKTTREEKESLHLAAVMVNNFVNHLYALTEIFLKDQKLDLTHLTEIMKATIHKAQTNSAFSAQTGPAVRFDQKTVEKQLAMLEKHPHLQEIYRTMTHSIQKLHSQ